LVFTLRPRAGQERANLRVRVFYHDKCFDGACSAALFSRFYRERIRSDGEFVYTGLLHRAGALFNEQDFDGDENAIVDFKYSSSPKITWWFDHHESAFLSPATQRISSRTKAIASSTIPRSSHALVLSR
jgi:hypothetical protein